MPTEWRNKRGKSMWQPTLASGERLWTVYMRGVPVDERWLHPIAEVRKDAALYPRRTAKRIERSEQKQRDRKLYDETYREVRADRARRDAIARRVTGYEEE